MRNKNVMMCASVDGVDSISSSSFSLISNFATRKNHQPCAHSPWYPKSNHEKHNVRYYLPYSPPVLLVIEHWNFEVISEFQHIVRSTGRKVEDPDVLERIRLTIINNLLKYHPESSERLAMGEAFGVKPPEKKIDVEMATHIHVKEDGLRRSLLSVETADRPGLLLEIIKIMSDINITVESAEIDTEGLVAKDRFHVNYRGAAVNSSLCQVLVNCLRYYLRRPETDEESY